jgi:P27 family predicted phage terminase small subunit
MFPSGWMRMPARGNTISQSSRHLSGVAPASPRTLLYEAQKAQPEEHEGEEMTMAHRPNRRRPTIFKEADGTMKESDRNPYEPKGTRGVPPAPKHLTREERASYSYFAKQVAALAVCTVQDAAALEMLACTHAEVRRLRAFLNKNGRTYTTKTSSGSTMRRPHPEVSMLAKAEQQLRLLLGSFGLTPADRPNVASFAARSVGHDPSDPDAF